MSESSPRRVFLWLLLLNAAFGYVEAAVVVYLRRIAYPQGFAFPLAPLDPSLAATEVAREAATLIMLAAAACLAARTPWGRFGAFAVGFGVWDLVYYAGLKALLGWPESWSTWDVLFLIPGIWTGPVWSAAAVAACFVVCGWRMMALADGGLRPRTRWFHWLAASVSLMLLLGAFLANHRLALGGGVPVDFPWAWWGLGALLGLAAFYDLFVRRPRRP